MAARLDWITVGPEVGRYCGRCSLAPARYTEDPCAIPGGVTELHFLSAFKNLMMVGHLAWQIAFEVLACWWISEPLEWVTWRNWISQPS